MANETRLNGAIKAIHSGFNRVAARIAGLTFWQFVLLAIILIAAAGIGEDLWDKPASRRIHITRDRPTASADRPGAVPGGKDSVTAEIHIDENGIVIRRKSDPKDKSAPPQAADESAAATAAPGIAPDAQNKQTPQSSEPGNKETGSDKGPGLTRKPEPAASGATANAKESVDVQLPGIQVSDTDLEDLNDITRHTSRPHLVTIALLLVLALFVMRMFARAQQRAEQKADAAVAVADRETLQRQIVEARLQLLQAQVEPHFLFNTLAAVEHLIETAPPRAAQMQRHLIEYLRAALPRMRQQSATLGQEVELCVSYLKIMQMRMEERLQFEVAVPAGLSSASFPPMMIQSLVENSIRHGLEPKPEGGSVNLRAEVRDGKLCVIVEDTGMGFSAAAPAGIGLANIRERLQQLFGANATLTIEPAQPRGTRATITVPYAVA
jgi:hypothetical protein